jgi:hypothetical protein
MNLAINPLIAIGVAASTAATDAAYVAPRRKSRAAAPRSAIALPFFKNSSSAEPLTLPGAVREAEARSLLARKPV